MSNYSDDRGRSRFRDYSRWTDEEKLIMHGVPTIIPDVLDSTELEALLIRIRIEEIGNKLAYNQLDVDLRARSPSPPPIYDHVTGKRINTREQRSKDKLMEERQRLVERAKVMNSSYVPPADYRPFTTKKSRKIFVPVKDYPDYNFIGLILGPRGLTQRQMEQETGAKISLRGKGSVRDGKGKSATKDNNEDEDLHVIITADTEESLDHAETLVRRLLVPVEEGKNEVKRKQLRILAEINGTLRDNTYGHEKEERARRAAVEMVCKWCGESSHPSSDCTQRGKISSNRVGKRTVTRDYYELMVSLGEDISDVIVQDSTDNDVEMLLDSIGAYERPADPKERGNFPPGYQSNGPPSSRYQSNHFSNSNGTDSADDIPPWERMDIQTSKPAAEEIPPWEM